MARPLRLQFPGACYHVTSRGNDRQNIVRDDGDRARFVQILSRMVIEHKLFLYAWVLMDNHYHLLVETPDANLSDAIRQLNGIYTQWFNVKRDRVGHLFQGRYKSILVDRDAYLKTLCRYIALNPVRAKRVDHPREYPWGGFRATAGYEPAPPWLRTGRLLGQFHKVRQKARSVYRGYVLDGSVGEEAPWKDLTGQVFLGREAFLEGLKQRVEDVDEEIPLEQRSVRRLDPMMLMEKVRLVYGLGEKGCLLQKRFAEARRVAMYVLRVEGGLSLRAIGDVFGVCYSSVSHHLSWVRRGIETDERFAKKVANCQFKT